MGGNRRYRHHPRSTLEGQEIQSERIHKKRIAMSFGRIKVRKVDSLFSNYIRDKNNFTCERCGRRHEWGSQGIHASHFIGRSNEAVRFDEENVRVLCHGCHSYFHKNPQSHVDWMKHKLGEAGYNKLVIRANQYIKRDDKLQKIILDRLIEELRMNRLKGIQ